MSERVLVFGASNQVGHYLLSQLIATKVAVFAVTRAIPDGAISDIRWIQADIEIEKEWMLPVGGISTVFYLAPLPLLPKIIPQLVNLHVKRLIAFSSTSCLTKINSTYLADRRIAENFQRAESELIKTCEKNSIAWTILRPTIIYSDTKDKSIRLIINGIKKCGLFPLIGQGKGLRQPVHAADLAIACMNVWHSKTTYGQCYNLSGGETLTYKEMVTKVFLKLNKKPRFIIIPTILLRIALRILGCIPKYSFLNPEMANRMNHDHYFDHQKAATDFDYKPRAFLPFIN